MYLSLIFFRGRDERLHGLQSIYTGKNMSAYRDRLDLKLIIFEAAEANVVSLERHTFIISEFNSSYSPKLKGHFIPKSKAAEFWRCLPSHK